MHRMHKYRGEGQHHLPMNDAQPHHTILIITEVFGIMAGSERNITQLLNGIDSDRFTLHLACIRSGELADESREQGHSIFDLRPGGIYTMRGLCNIRFLRDLMRKKHVDLIVTYHESADFYGLILSLVCGVPVISSRRDMGFNAKKHHHAAYRLLGRFFDAEITVCHAVKEEMIRLGWFPAERLFPIYNGVDLKMYENSRYVNTADQLRTMIGLQAGQPVVGLIANLRRIKGIQYFIEAASLIHSKKPDVQFLIVGNDMQNPGYTMADLKQFARNLHLEKNIHFLGMRPDIPGIISVFDIAVVASLTEGFSNTILEYMASSKPVVATKVGGNSEAVLHEQTGLVVPPGNSSALAEAIWSILEGPDAAQRFGIAGRKRAEEQFSLDMMIRNYEHLFERVIQNRNNGHCPGGLLRRCSRSNTAQMRA
ncbi:MAG: glycosyltransferase [Nitrospirota bacterium]